MRDEFKIEIREKTNFEGVTYYYLYVDGQFIKLSRSLEEIQTARNVAVNVYKEGKHIERVIDSVIL